jgi:hypothetical protein
LPAYLRSAEPSRFGCTAAKEAGAGSEIVDDNVSVLEGQRRGGFAS